MLRLSLALRVLWVRQIMNICDGYGLLFDAILSRPMGDSYARPFAKRAAINRPMLWNVVRAFIVSLADRLCLMTIKMS
jgi:hypothetical protein